MQILLVRTQNSHRSVVTIGVLHDVRPHPDLPETLETGLQALLDGAVGKEKTGGELAATLTGKSVVNDLTWGTTWDLMHAVEVIAATTLDLSTEARSALGRIPDVGGFTVPHARKKAKYVRSALSLFPDTFKASGKTKAEILAAIDAVEAADREEEDLRTALKAANDATRLADKALDAENKRIYKILQVCFPKGSREWLLVQGIPTSTAKTKKGNTTTTTTTTGGMTLPKK